MSIAQFIKDDVLQPRLKQSGCLVVYDGSERYKDLCLSLSGDEVHVVDTSDSGIESREAALSALSNVGSARSAVESVLVYVPTRRPETDEAKQADPFAVYGAAGSVFPRSDGDEYESLCLRAKPDHATEVRKVFASTPGGPPFAVIDAIGGGVSWPQLRATLEVESAREILLALIAPSSKQADVLKSPEGWASEAPGFLEATLGMAVKTKSKSWKALSAELWRFVLFSEFVFDLPADLPEALQDVPRAPSEARPIIDHVCERLRADPRTQTKYIEEAERIETELNLVSLCAAIDDLGERDTFPFEERTFLNKAINDILAGQIDGARKLLARHGQSVWLSRGESRAQWDLVRSALSLIEACGDFERQLADHARSQANLLDFYQGSLREADRLHREFEQSAGEFFDTQELMAGVIEKARASYRGLSEKVEGAFIKHLESAGWPPDGRSANADTFDRLVAPRLQESGHRVAYFLVDALRYELGVALEKQLSEDGPVELQVAYAQLPTITPVGMASLLPGAGTGLSLGLENGSLAPKLNGVAVGNVNQRMDILAKRYGDRFAQMTLNEFVRKNGKVGAGVDLLVLRSTEIDSQLETNPETTLGLIPGVLKAVRVALHKLRRQGFKAAVIATDHGFFLNGQAEAGDVCVKPSGSWGINAHDRMLLGAGTADSHSVVLNSAHVGVRGFFAQVALPRSMAPYRAGHLYFHGGASLAEAVVPVLVVNLDNAEPADRAQFEVELRYKKGATRITTRLPVVEVVVLPGLFIQSGPVEILLEAQTSKGEIIGEARPGGEVDPATRTITLSPGSVSNITMRMEDDYEGAFTIKALNPTTLAIYASLSLKTDYAT